MMLYNEELPPYEGVLPEAVQSCLEEIKQFFGLEKLRLLQYSETRIAVPVTYHVSLPSRGPINGVDIREEEPVMIVISVHYYPSSIPRVVHDRKNFPINLLPHLYVSEKDKPAAFCLVRNSPDEWFANKRMADLLIVAGQWLFKAGNGLLVEDNQEFDPIRLESYSGYHIYSYRQIHDVVAANRRFIDHLSMAVFSSSIVKSDMPRYKSTMEVSSSTLPYLLDLMSTISDEQEEKLSLKLLFTPVVWRNTQETEDFYCTDFPATFGHLKIYFSQRGIDIKSILQFCYQNKLLTRNGVPLIHAVKRPKKIVGCAGNYEFINFLIHINDQANGIIPDDALVQYLSHIEPFSETMAVNLSKERRDVSTLYIGGGSLGSKMIVHDARSGKMNIGVVDPDDFLEHNLARHVLFESNIGSNKAKALVKEISSLFKVDATSGYKAYEENFALLSEDSFTFYQWLVDTSASKQVQNLLVNRVFPEDLSIARCELVNDGQLGLLYIEGKERNPRIDDLMALTHYLATENRFIENWRRSDEKRQLTTLDIGLGCSSSTTVMSDDTISYHASLFSKVLYQEQERKSFGNAGFLFRSILDTTGIPQTRTEHQIVKPFEVYQCQSGSGWQVRFANGMASEFFRLCKRRGKVETGGALIGLANYKTKTIHVFQIVVEPRGSRGTCVGFTRGIGGLPEHINQIKEITGQVIGYVGEWHTHPMDLERLSSRDEATIQELLPLNRKVPIPTLALIVTNAKILPFVYD